MFKKSKILKKLGAGFMAGLCAFSMFGSSMSGAITASAASTPMENPAFPSADTDRKGGDLAGYTVYLWEQGILVCV